jgi:hypothetical protein
MGYSGGVTVRCLGGVAMGYSGGVTVRCLGGVARGYSGGVTVRCLGGVFVLAPLLLSASVCVPQYM